MSGTLSITVVSCIDSTNRVVKKMWMKYSGKISWKRRHLAINN